MTVGADGVLQSQPELESSAGKAKLEGRPTAADPDNAHYTVPAKDSATGNKQGVLRSNAAVLAH